MTGSDEEFQKFLLATFREDADELLSRISQGLIKLEKKHPTVDSDLIEEILRDSHSLKGAAHAVNLQEMESVCLNLERAFLQIKKSLFSPDTNVFDLFHRAIKVIRSILEDDKRLDNSAFEIIQHLRELEPKNDEGSKKTEFNELTTKTSPSDSKYGGSDSGKNNACDDAYHYKNMQVLTSTTIHKKNGKMEREIEYNYPEIKNKDTIRIPTKKFDRLIAASDGLLSTQLFISHRLRELEEILSRFNLWNWNHAQIYNNLHIIEEITSRSQKTDLPPDILVYLEHIIDFLQTNRDFVNTLHHDLTVHTQSTYVDRDALDASTHKISDLIQDAVLVPVSSILTSFSGIVRENSRSLGKLIELKISGDEIEMDRRILESLHVPLMHIIYNCIDYGIEYPAVRMKQQKPKTGVIQIEVIAHSGSKVLLEVSDDGAGIDYKKIRQIAVKKGIINAKEAEDLTEEETIQLIFLSGFSTSSVVTNLSGRGLGMAIVEDIITRLGGEIQVITKPGIGTKFSLIMPMKLATMRGLVVQSGNYVYILPIHQIQQVLRIPRTSIHKEESGLFLKLHTDTIRVMILNDALGLPDYYQGMKKEDYLSVVIITYGTKHIAYIVDEVIWVQDIIIRPLGTQLRWVSGITGAVILGDGRLALVLDPTELTQEIYAQNPIIPLVDPDDKKTYRVLIVDDSVTLRTMMEHILTRAGYQVKIAVNGIEALKNLKEEDYDIVVSDVDMPRMNGFTLTEKIRAFDRTKQMPVVLVTALDTYQDQEFGFTVGATAYIIKKTFEQNNFLKVIQQLLEHSHCS